MITRLSSKCLLRPADFQPSQDDLEVIGAFNPGAIQTEDGVVLLVRIAEQAKERRIGHTALPRWNVRKKRVELDCVENTEIAPVDVRVVRSRKIGLIRLTFTSHLRVVYSKDGRNIDSLEGARFVPEAGYEEFGIEDPRITKIGETYYITYVAVSCHGVATALASTRDFKTFQRHGIIFPPENKDVLLFPERIGEYYYALHRPNAASQFTKPEMWLATSPDLAHWGNHEQFLGGRELWDVGRIGGGTPPIRTARGWLEIYHGNSRKEEDAGIGTYSAGALLLDIENPRHIIGRSGQIFVPETEYEIEGFVPNVVFPTGIIQQDDRLLVYYGAADTFSGLVEFSLQELVSAVAKK
ncbi:MAG TPA: glycoside hydrolase family 130 protein [Candidatus Binatia bacterium]|nr:glycoside hydrolase family 130 protein [Candidatus Binatia bacterium]